METIHSDVLQGHVLTRLTLKKTLQTTIFKDMHVRIPWVQQMKKWLYTKVQCTADVDCDVSFTVYYYIKAAGVPVKTLVVTELGVHNHMTGRGNSGKIMVPAMSELACSLCQSDQQVTAKTLRHSLLQKGWTDTMIPTIPQLTDWIKNLMKSHKKGNYAAQPGSQYMAEIIKRTLSEWQGEVPQAVDGLVIPMPHPSFECKLVSAERTCVIFFSTGMLETLKRFNCRRMHITVDVKMNTLQNQRGIATITLISKDKLRNTSFHHHKYVTSPDCKKVQGKAFTSHGSPVLQAIVSEESEDNMTDLFRAFVYMWQLAHPHGPTLDVVLRQVHKDFAPGIEAARKNVLHFTRACDDFFHFMGKEKEMASRCITTHMDSKGAFVKTHLDYCKAVLYDIQNCATVDMTSCIWGAFLRRLICMGEVRLAQYFFQQYTNQLSIAELHSMHIATNATDETTILLFVSFIAGLSQYPGSNCGSGPAEAVHSTWEKKLQKSKPAGRTMSPEQCLAFMSKLYQDPWKKMYEWEATKELQIIPQEDDPQFLNGMLLEELGRTTAFSWWNTGAPNKISYIFTIGNNLVVVMPRTCELPLLERGQAELGVRILLNHGDMLQDLLCEAGILYHPTDPEQETGAAAISECFQKIQVPRLRTGLRKYLAALGVVINDAGEIEAHNIIGKLFSLSKYRALFVDTVYILRDTPNGIKDEWPYLRCTCVPFSQYAGCEHAITARALDLPGMVDTAITPGSVPRRKNSGGRPKHVYKTNHGTQKKAKAKKSVSDKAVRKHNVKQSGKQG